MATEATAGPPPVELRSARWWFRGLSKVVMGALLAGAPIFWFADNYKIGFDAVKGANCLPESVFLIHLKDRDVRPGDYVAFRSEQMEPFYENGTTAIKIFAGKPGDRVDIDERGAAVAGKFWGRLVHLEEGGRLTEMGEDISDYRKSLVIAEGRMWMMAPLAKSYDSRYWGPISTTQVIGRVTPII